MFVGLGLLFGGWVLIAMVRVLRTPPKEGASWTWGAFWWGPLYYVVHGMHPKAWPLFISALVLGALTWGIIGPVFWIYCAIDAGKYWPKIQAERRKQEEEDHRLQQDRAVARERRAKTEELEDKRRQLEAARVEKEFEEFQANTASPAAAPAPSPSVEDRLTRLSELHTNGLITLDEYNTKRQAVIDEL